MASSMPAAPSAPVASIADNVIRASRPVPVTPPQQAINPVAADADESPVKKMRSLEEVRADLARLRANARERHAQLQAQAQAEAQARRDIGFAPTDFLDFTPPKPEPAPKDNTGSSYAPTAFFDLVSLKADPAPNDKSASSYAPTAFCEPVGLKTIH
ncbi:hypothetical protein A8M77_14145 [Variovorax sp. JS1663]|nr:hypothetical protein A8M77_14145 [Variovorax sp. JS1663]